jgi:hypothetical protein
VKALQMLPLSLKEAQRRVTLLVLEADNLGFQITDVKIDWVTTGMDLLEIHGYKAPERR